MFMYFWSLALALLAALWRKTKHFERMRRKKVQRDSSRVTDVVCLSLCVSARAKTMIPEAKCNLDRCVCYGGVSGSGYGRLMV